MQGRRKAGEYTRGHTDEEREEQQARIDGRLQSVRGGITRQKCNERSHGKRGEHNPEQSTHKRD